MIDIKNSLMSLSCPDLMFLAGTLVPLPDQLYNIRSCLTSQFDKDDGDDNNSFVAGVRREREESVPDMAFKGLEGLTVDLFMGFGKLVLVKFKIRTTGNISFLVACSDVPSAGADPVSTGRLYWSLDGSISLSTDKFESTLLSGKPTTPNAFARQTFHLVQN